MGESDPQIDAMLLWKQQVVYILLIKPQKSWLVGITILMVGTMVACVKFCEMA